VRLSLVGVTVLVLAFVGATVYWREVSSAIDHEAESILTDQVPSVRSLDSVQRGVSDMTLAVADEVDRLEAGEPLTRGVAFDNARQSVDAALASYLTLPESTDERILAEQAAEKVGALQAALEGVLKAVDAGDLQAAQLQRSRTVRPAFDAAVKAVTGAVDLNGKEAEDAADRVITARARASRIALALSVASTLLAIALLVLVANAARNNLAIAAERNRVSTLRAEELEHFAGHVAHDIRGPVGTALLSLDVGARSADPTIRESATRGSQALRRVGHIIDDLLAFSRSGGRPDPGAHTEVRHVIDGVVDEVAPEANRIGADIQVVPGPPRQVAAGEGMVSVLLSNLVRNAVQVLEHSDERHIVVEARDVGPSVRVEVSDSGPGVPPAVRPSLFDLPVHGDLLGQAAGVSRGLGLGLATVRRAAEAHGGRVGLDSPNGHGTRFWFELPRVY
jgi:signal transduction histidine kinase